MSLSDDNIVFAAIDVVPVPDVVVATAPPLSAIVPPPLKVRLVLAGCVNVKLPPEPLEKLAVDPGPGPVMVMLLVPPFTLNAEAPVAFNVGVEAAVSPLRVRFGLVIFTAPPPVIVAAKALKMTEAVAEEVFWILTELPLVVHVPAPEIDKLDPTD